MIKPLYNTLRIFVEVKINEINFEILIRVDVWRVRINIEVDRPSGDPNFVS